LAAAVAMPPPGMSGFARGADVNVSIPSNAREITIDRRMLLPPAEVCDRAENTQWRSLVPTGLADWPESERSI